MSKRSDPRLIFSLSQYTCIQSRACNRAKPIKLLRRTGPVEGRTSDFMTPFTKAARQNKSAIVTLHTKSQCLKIATLAEDPAEVQKFATPHSRGTCLNNATPHRACVATLLRLQRRPHNRGHRRKFSSYLLLHAILWRGDSCTYSVLPRSRYTQHIGRLQNPAPLGVCFPLRVWS